MAAFDDDAFVALGLASCFVREGNELLPVQVIEPVPSAALLALVDGTSPTSYSMIVPTSIGRIVDAQGRLAIPDGFPENAQFAHDFTERLQAAARTFIANPHAIEKLPNTLNLDNPPTQQRILNSAHVVNDEDNIKQHEHTHKIL